MPRLGSREMAQQLRAQTLFQGTQVQFPELKGHLATFWNSSSRALFRSPRTPDKFLVHTHYIQAKTKLPHPPPKKTPQTFQNSDKTPGLRSEPCMSLSEPFLPSMGAEAVFLTVLTAVSCGPGFASVCVALTNGCHFVFKRAKSEGAIPTTFLMDDHGTFFRTFQRRQGVLGS